MIVILAHRLDGVKRAPPAKESHLDESLASARKHGKLAMLAKGISQYSRRVN
jgi:hypothetical protein